MGMDRVVNNGFDAALKNAKPRLKSVEGQVRAVAEAAQNRMSGHSTGVNFAVVDEFNSTQAKIDSTFREGNPITSLISLHPNSLFRHKQIIARIDHEQGTIQIKDKPSLFPVRYAAKKVTEFLEQIKVNLHDLEIKQDGKNIAVNATGVIA